MKALFGKKKRQSSTSSPSTKFSLLPSPRLPPAFAMSSSTLSPLPHKKLLVSVINEGVFIKNAVKGGEAVLCRWAARGEDAKLELLESGQEDRGEEGDGPRCECDGVVGLLKLFNDTYLLCISASHTVATLPSPSSSPTNPNSHRIRKIDQILAIPLNSSRALPALQKHIERLAQLRSSPAPAKASVPQTPTEEKDPEVGMTDAEATETEDETETESENKIEKPKRPTQLTKLLWRSNSRRSVRDGVTRLGSLPLPPSPPNEKEEAPEKDPKQPDPSADMEKDENEEQPVVQVKDNSASQVVAEPSSTELPVQPTSNTSGSEKPPSQVELDQKILRETIREFKGMYFSPDFDVTNSLQRRLGSTSTRSSATEVKDPKMGKAESKSSSSSDGRRKSSIENPLIPLWRKSDRRFFWNLNLVKPLISAGLHSFIYPIQQGFVSYSALALPSQPELEAELIIISRRSAERAGLRYLRRGANQDGETANFVETEMILVTETEVHHVNSYRQSPWSLKPVPIIERTPADRLAALTAHFESQTSIYGRQVIVNLAEQHGKEGLIVQEYEDRVKEMGRDDVKYFAWDFHKETRGMKYENIALLGAELKKDLQDIGSFWFSDGDVLATQNGVFRTNCMDCLDRTNVVQSALSRWMLTLEFERLGVSISDDPSKHDELDKILNVMWADNGDAISRHYAGTSALKGDFTRTGKRNWRGMVNDATNSLARMFQNTVADYFKQSVIDYFLGVNLSPANFYSLTSLGADPGELLRLTNIRKLAIDTVAQECMEAEETKIGGWTMLSPTERDRVRSDHYEEKVLLMTEKALYVASYEYSLQKVREFVRIPLIDITRIQRGSYILSSLDASARDGEENYGFIVFYSPHDSISRARTYTIRNKNRSQASSTPSTPPTPSDLVAGGAVEHSFAFKAMRKDLIRIAATGSFFANTKNSALPMYPEDEPGKTGKDSVGLLVEKIQKECIRVGGTSEEDKEFVVEKDIIRITHNLKSYIWL
ncbi:hypothetical protein BT69DRAFT_1286632 [Atractiella rhizophila]|nr:hypothetical protein BT69DRAFT_1286632 [Atractiella rhizophila]